MPFRLHIAQAMLNILSSKLRSFLAVLGILVGTASVVALVSSGQLASQKALDQFKNLGTDLMSMSFFKASDGGSNNAPDDFELDEIEAMPQYVPDVRRVAPYSTLYVPITYGGKYINGSIIGATESLPYVIKIAMQQGRFISFLDGYSYYCVLGKKIYDQIQKFENKSPLGTQIKLGKHFFTIVGIANHWPENSFFNADINSSIIIPAPAAQLVSKYSKIRNMVMQLKQEADINMVQAAIKHYVDTHSVGLRTFFRSASQLIDSMTKQQQILTLMLGMIGSISLLVGGIGVMNVMLVSVAERRQEIGIRMAVGAKSRDIRQLFLVEAVILTLFGGILGIGTGVVVSYFIATFSQWDFMIFYLPPTLGFIVSVATGIFFGYYPAYRASKLDPIQTLRYE